MKNITEKAPAIEGERKERTVTIRIAKGTNESEAAYLDFLKTRAEIKRRKQMEKVFRRNSKTV